VRNEDTFNSFLSREFGRLAPDTAKLKMAEKYHIGIPDFCLWRKGRSVLFESKFIPTLGLPASKGQVLKHPFTGPQQTFLHTMLRAGVSAFGLVGIGDVRQMVLLPANFIPESGSWSTSGFVSLAGSDSPMFGFDEVPRLVDSMFSYEVVGAVCRQRSL
jgi:hypothetical protein